MQQYTCDTSLLPLPRKLLILLPSLILPDLLLYPLDRLKTLIISRQPPLFTEFSYLYRQILEIEGWSGFFTGVKASIDKTFTMNLTRFFIFDYLVGRREWETLERNELAEELDEAQRKKDIMMRIGKDMEIGREKEMEGKMEEKVKIKEEMSEYEANNQKKHENLNGIEGIRVKLKKPNEEVKKSGINYGKIYAAALIATSASACLSQLANVLRIKIQTDSLGAGKGKSWDPVSHKYKEILELNSKGQGFLFKCGAGSHLLFCNFHMLAELSLFLGFYSALPSNVSILIPVAAASVVSSFLSHPLELAHVRTTLLQLEDKESKNFSKFLREIKEKEGIRGLFKGVGLNATRTAGGNIMVVGGIRWMMERRRIRRKLE